MDHQRKQDDRKFLKPPNVGLRTFRGLGPAYCETPAFVTYGNSARRA